jgi:hypothetical protein
MSHQYGYPAEPSTPDDVQIFAPEADWPRIRDEPRFLELMRLARVANSLALAYKPLMVPVEDQSPEARRERFVGLFYAAGLLWEGLRTAESLGKWFRDLPQFQQGFGELFKDPDVRTLRTTLLDPIRNQVVFHFDRDAVALGLARLPMHDVVVATYPGTGPSFRETYFDVADNAVLNFLFGDSASDDEYLRRLSDFMLGVGTLLQRYQMASHRLVAAGLVQLGCKRRSVRREEVPPEDGQESARSPGQD